MKRCSLAWISRGCSRFYWPYPRPRSIIFSKVTQPTKRMQTVLILRAVELYALARRYPPAGNAQWFEDVAGKRISAAAAQLPPAVVQAARERGRSQDAFAVAQELLAEFSQSTEPPDP